VGYDYVHVAVDDHSRLAYVEVITLAQEWAYAAVYDSSAQRVAALPAWLHGYNHHGPHTALTGHPPALPRQQPLQRGHLAAVLRQ